MYPVFIFNVLNKRSKLQLTLVPAHDILHGCFCLNDRLVVIVGKIGIFFTYHNY